MNEIIEKLEQYIAKEILKKTSRKINPDEALISSGLVDSFHLVDLSIFIEDEFGVLIGDSELNADTIDTLNQLAEMIQSRRS
jgi:acyl carrier protein